MPLQFSTPVLHNDNQYPYFIINLAVSPNIVDNNISGSVSLILTPYRVLENGEAELCSEKLKIFAYADIFKEIVDGDVALSSVVSGIMEKIQEFTIAKGL